MDPQTHQAEEQALPDISDRLATADSLEAAGVVEVVEGHPAGRYLEDGDPGDEQEEAGQC
jgi:hypothetical protein